MYCVDQDHYSWEEMYDLLGCMISSPDQDINPD